MIGVILAIYGYFTMGDAMYEVSLGENINLIWGLVLIGAGSLFGISSLLTRNS
jgi:hypothetical protein